eukprot:TRINITY_DN12555_c0_g1_i1.p1 TRINITY_DN12555_c0_g1~~TRINITY_DN12555_c0_g1_i1.p1  ORF type:complete len:101 (-),score=12.32 TRINITY_DN12555_c0_g1_i1:593-895(-)
MFGSPTECPPISSTRVGVECRSPQTELPNLSTINECAWVSTYTHMWTQAQDTFMHVSTHINGSAKIHAEMHKHGHEQWGAPKSKTEKITETGGTTLFIQK